MTSAGGLTIFLPVHVCLYVIGVPHSLVVDILHGVLITSLCRYITSRLEVFCRKDVLKISQKSQEDTCARVSFLIKLLALFKKRLWHKRFPVNFTKFLRTPCFIEYLRCCFCRCFPLNFTKLF